MNSSEATPYRPLGRHLKQLRTRANESLAEASGAVEIDVRDLANFELGTSKPSEDVLLLLISHFGARDDEAVSLWEMAGYSSDKIPVARMDNSERSPDLLANTDNRVLFTDTVDIMVNNYGVVMNFMQSGQRGAQLVARVGMSREHAASVLKVLEDTLSHFENFKARKSNTKDTQKPQ